MKKVGQILREGVVGRIKAGMENNNNVFLLSYKNVSGEQLTDLRLSLQKSGATVYASKNTIATIALKDLDHGKLAEKISDQTAFVWSNADSVEVSKALMDFTKDSETITVQGGLLEGKVIFQEDVKKLADLPSREVLLSMLVSAVQSPLSGLASVLNAKTKELLSVLKQISEQKGGN